MGLGGAGGGGSLLKVARDGGFTLGDHSEAPMFYTNFEVVHVGRFVESDMWRFALAVDSSHGTYIHNWGDAQVRHLKRALKEP